MTSVSVNSLLERENKRKDRVSETSISRDSLWSGDDLLRWAGLLVIGIGLWAVGWYRSGGVSQLGNQIGDVDLAVVGVTLASVSHAIWLLRGRRAIGERRRLLLGDPVTSEPQPIAKSSDVPQAPARFVAGDNSRFFHRPGCPMAQGRSWGTEPGEADLSTQIPCGVCRP